MEPILKWNPISRRFEGTYVVEVEEEILMRAFFRYIEENHIDFTNLAAYQEAVNRVARIGRWLDHARTVARPIETPAPAPVVQPAPIARPSFVALAPAEPARVSPLALPANHVRRGRKPGPAKRVKYHVMSLEEVEAFRARALATPVEQWETLKTPLLKGIKYGTPLTRERRDNYYRRSDENTVLKALKAEMEPAKLDTLEAVAGAINGLRHG